MAAGQEYIIFLLIFELDFEAESHCIIQVPVGMLLKKFLCPIQQISRRNKFMFIRRGKGSRKRVISVFHCHYSCCICLIMGLFKHGCVNLHLLHRLGICHGFIPIKSLQIKLIHVICVCACAPMHIYIPVICI